MTATPRHTVGMRFLLLLSVISISCPGFVYAELYTLSKSREIRKDYPVSTLTDNRWP